MQKLLAAVRKICPPGLWSQGVKLARDGAVLRDAQSGAELSLRVRSPGRVVAPSVVLYPDDGEWTCDCGGKVDPCEHVAAAVIALGQGGGDEPTRAVPLASDAGGRLRYRLRRKSGALALERSVVQPDGSEELLKTSLASTLARGAGGPVLTPTHEDLTIDRMVGTRQPGWFPAERMAELFGALSSTDLWLDDTPVKASGEAIPPCAVVDDDGDGVVVLIDRDPRVVEVVAGDIVRCGETIHPMRETDLTGPRLEKLPLRRAFQKSQLGVVVTEVLPDLVKRMPVDVKTLRLPKTERATRPRIAFELTHDKHALSVLPLLVYGDPPQARVDAGELLHLSGPVPMRDRVAERTLVDRLRDELHLVPGRRVDFDGADAIRFAARLDVWEERAGGVAHRPLTRRGILEPRLSVDGRAFDLTFELRGEDGAEAADGAPAHANVAAVLRAWGDGLPLVPLEGGGWAPLPEGWLERYGALVSDLLASRRDDGEVATVALPALADLCDALDAPRPRGIDRLVPLIEGFAAIPEAVLPPDLRAELRPYQQRGVSWLCFLRDAGLGAVLADDMGLGKTLQTLCALNNRTLVVCPRSVVHNWADEIRRFRPSLSVALYHGPKRSLDRAVDVTLTTYAVLRLDAEALAAEAWGTVVLDEAQAIKNPDSQVARAAYALRAEQRVALSGTPVENRLDELWSQLHFTNPGLLGGRSAFQERYERPIAAGDPGVAALLRKKVRPFVLRRMKGEVAPELPPRSEAVLYCELDERERAVYDAVRAATQKEVVTRLAEGAGVLVALEALLRLRQASCHSGLVPGQEAASSSKIERLLEALEDAAADGHKALVFSQWTSLLDRIEPHLVSAGIGFTRLDGSTRDRAGVVATFQDPGGPPVLLASLKAGGTGLNLTAADHVFLLDPWWNPAAEDQAADRAHRIGQDRPVMVYRLVAKDTVEEGILALQQRKRALAEAALGEASQAAAITRDNLLALLV